MIDHTAKLKFIQPGVGCEHSLPNLLLEHNKRICWESPIFPYQIMKSHILESHIPAMCIFHLTTTQHSCRGHSIEPQTDVKLIIASHLLQLSGLSNCLNFLPPFIPISPLTSQMREGLKVTKTAYVSRRGNLWEIVQFDCHQ